MTDELWGIVRRLERGYSAQACAGELRALLSASKPAAPAQSVAQDERGALTPNQFAAIRAGCASLQKHGGYAPFGIVLQEMLDQARAASTSANAAAPAQSGED